MRYSCSRRAFLTHTATAVATTAAGALLAACAGEKIVAEAATTDIPVGGAVIIDSWVISQPVEGEFHAFSTVCPHASGTIDTIAEKDGRTVAVCPKHGSEFDVATGDVVVGPARDPMRAAANVSTEAGSVKVAD